MAKSSNSVIDEKTGLTVVQDYNLYQAPSRRFHTIESLSEAVENAGFVVENVIELEERLCKDWNRLVPSESDATIIQMIVKKY